MTPLHKKTGDCTKAELVKAAQTNNKQAKFWLALASHMNDTELANRLKDEDVARIAHLVGTECGLGAAIEKPVKAPKPWSKNDIRSYVQ